LSLGYYSIISGFSSIFSSLSKSAFLSFLDFINKKIPPAATTRQHIQTTGLTAIQAIHIVTNPTTRVNHRATIPVHTHIIFDKKGRTFANVTMNWNNIENPQYINISQSNLRAHVIILFSSCASRNISSALTLP
jgi:hypothetical protein